MPKTPNAEVAALHGRHGLKDPEAYAKDAYLRGGRIIEQSETPDGFIATTWEFGASDEAYEEVTYTKEPFPVGGSLPEFDPLPELDLAAGFEQPLAMIPTERDYTTVLERDLTVRHEHLAGEVARLNRLLVDAMHAESAVAAALSTIRNRRQD